MQAYDVLGVGEAVVRLAPPAGQRLEQAAELAVQVSGAECCTLVGLARLGLRTAWVSRLTNNAWGRRIASALAYHGVDLRHVVWTDEDRVGCEYLDPGVGVQCSQIDDRLGSAMSRMGPEDVDPGLVAQASALHLSGITPGLSPSCRRLAEAMVRAANHQGALVAFAASYRPGLWSPMEAAAALAPLCSRADVLFITCDDAAAVFGATGGPAEVLRALRTRLGARLMVLALGREGAAALERDGTAHTQSALAGASPGAGDLDAFCAGFLGAYLEAGGAGSGPQHGAEAGNESDAVAAGLRYGVACAALQGAAPGALPTFTRQEVEALLAASASGTARAGLQAG